MHKNVQIVSIADIQGKLPRLPFVNILGTIAPADTLDRLPTHMVELANTKSASRAVVFLRFEKNTLRSGEHDLGTSVMFVKGWLEKMVKELNATQNGDNQFTIAYQAAYAGWTPPQSRYPHTPDTYPHNTMPGQRPLAWPDTRYGAPGGFRPAGYVGMGGRPGYAPDQAFRAAPDFSEQTLYALAEGFVQQLTDPYPMDPKQTHFAVSMYPTKDGVPNISGSGRLGYGVSFEFSEVVDLEAHDRSVEAYKENEHNTYDTYLAVFQHLGKGYTVSFTHQMLGARLPEFITDDALQTAFNTLWCDFWTKLTGAEVRGPKTLTFIKQNQK
jgi:hypothetical protein